MYAARKRSKKRRKSNKTKLILVRSFAYAMPETFSRHFVDEFGSKKPQDTIFWSTSRFNVSQSMSLPIG